LQPLRLALQFQLVDARVQRDALLRLRVDDAHHLAGLRDDDLDVIVGTSQKSALWTGWPGFNGRHACGGHQRPAAPLRPPPPLAPPAPRPPSPAPPRRGRSPRPRRAAPNGLRRAARAGGTSAGPPPPKAAAPRRPSASGRPATGPSTPPPSCAAAGPRRPAGP